MTPHRPQGDAGSPAAALPSGRGRRLGRGRRGLATERRAQELACQEQQAALAREKHLTALAGQQDQTWLRVTALIDTKWDDLRRGALGAVVLVDPDGLDAGLPAVDHFEKHQTHPLPATTEAHQRH